MDSNEEHTPIFRDKMPAYDEASFLSLMSIYLSEWMHQDTILWNHAFAYFAFTFAVTVFPVACPWNLDKKVLAVLPLKLFPSVGIVLAFMLLFVMLGYWRRMRKSTTKYRDMIEMLDKSVREEKLHPQVMDVREDEQGKKVISFHKQRCKETPKRKGRIVDCVLGCNLTLFIAAIMFLVLLIAAIIVLRRIDGIIAALS